MPIQRPRPQFASSQCTPLKMMDQWLARHVDARLSRLGMSLPENCQLLLPLRDPLPPFLAVALLLAGDGVVLERAGVLRRGFLAVPLAGHLEADRVALDRAILNRRFGV